jgi:hypothetical protein
MPTAGLSLVGFMDEPHAIHHLKNSCVPPANAADADLLAHWNIAKGKLGLGVANAGQPTIQPIPPQYADYVNALFTLPWVTQALTGLTPTSVQLVEIEPLLAYQFTVDGDRSDQHCASLTHPPSMEQMLATCLPTAQPQEDFRFQLTGQSAIIKSRSLNLRMTQAGIIQNMAAGFLFGPALPLVQVTRFNGRCYLHNGFHRAVGLGKRGATHMPCILRDVPSAEAAGIRGTPATFGEPLLTSANPPTLSHFIRGRALDVQIRAVSRILHVSWADHIWAEE